MVKKTHTELGARENRGGGGGERGCQWVKNFPGIGREGEREIILWP